MPPRHVYWTIIVDGKPTAFRAHSRDELLPTLRQLQAKHPDAVMKWFARGKLWESQEEERAAGRRRDTGEHRGRDWRPGGEHQDARARFNVPRDVKRKRFAERQQRDRFDRGGWNRERPGGGDRPPRPWKPEARPDRPLRGPSVDRPDWKPRDRNRRPPGERESWNRDGPPRDRRPKHQWSPEGGRSNQPQDQERRWRPKGSRPSGRPPGGGQPDRRPHGGRPPSGRPPDSRAPGSRPPGGRPPGASPRGPGGWRKPGGGGGKKGGGGNR